MIARLLLVDDDEAVRRSLSSWLSRAGFEVFTADDGGPALTLAQTTLFDLVLVDYHMQQISGTDVVRQIKSLYGDTVYCAILSGQDDATTHAECMHAGADEVFFKPASPGELRRRLTEVALALRGA